MAWGFDQFQAHVMVALLLILLIIFIVIRVLKNSEAIGHWNHLFPEMNHDPDVFYDLVQELLRDRAVPDILSTKRTLKEGGMLSHQRLYLEVSRGDYIFRICAAPWGSGFFFSWWVRQRVTGIDELLILIPYFGPRIVKYRQFEAYYKLDTDAMFRKSVHQSVLAAIDRLTTAKGIRGLTELERQPTLKSVINKE